MSPPIPTAGVDQFQFEKVPDPAPLPTLDIRGRPVEEWVKPDAVQPLVWHTRATGRPGDLKLVPFYRVAHERYQVYFDEEISDGRVSTG